MAKPTDPPSTENARRYRPPEKAVEDVEKVVGEIAEFVSMGGEPDTVAMAHSILAAALPHILEDLREKLTEVHVSLLIAEELRGIREALETFGEGDLRGELSQALSEIVLTVKQAVSGV